jgi:hypothetical protein
MSVFRICLAEGERRMKADFKAADEHFARKSAETWFASSNWQIIEIKRVS